MPELKSYQKLRDQSLRVPPHKVYLRTHSDSEWELVEYLVAVGVVSWQVPPSFSQLTLEWVYGDGTRWTKSSSEVVEPFHPSHLIGRYVKVQWDHTDVPDEEDDEFKLPDFFGCVVGVVDPWEGDGKNAAGDAVARGVQHITVHGIEVILDMTPIMSSFVMTLDEHGQQQITEIGRTLQFNRLNAGAIDHRQRLEGNMTALFVEDEVMCFDGTGGSPSEDEESDFDPPEPWTLARVVEYLVHFHSPRNADGDKLIEFRVRHNECFEGLIEHEVVLGDYENLTVFRVLNQLLDRRRGLGWYIEPVEEEVDGSEGATKTVFEVVLFAFVGEDVELPIGGKLRPNPERVFDLNLTGDHLSQVQVHTDGHLEYDQVIARGARRGSIVNICNHSDAGDARIPFEEDWSTADDDALAEDWAKGMEKIPGYKDLQIERQRAVRDRYRKMRKFERLWSHFRIARDWDGRNAGGRPVFPQLGDDGEATDEPEKFWLPGLRLGRTLPLLADVDYSGKRIANMEEDAENSILADIKALPPGAHPEYMPLLCYAFMDNGGGELAWRPVDMLGAVDGIAGGWPYTVSCTPQETGPGFILKVRGGIRLTQRMLSGLGAADKDDGVAQEFTIDAKARMLVVAYVEQDQYLEHRIPLDRDVVNHAGEQPDVIRRMVISMPDCHLDWVPGYTVVGHHLWKEDEDATELINYKLSSTSQEAFVRDDRKRLETAAKLASLWYLVTRKPITITWRRLRKLLHLGDYIATLKQTARDDNPGVFEMTVNTPVTAVRYDLTNGTTTVQTAFGELDVRGLSR